MLRDGDMIAVLSEDRDQADVAISKIKAEYSFNEMPVNNKTMYEWYLKANTRSEVVRSEGDLEKGRQLSDKIFESEFHDPYLAHSPMETHTALAQLEGDKMTVWASTQSPFGLKDSLIRELGFAADKVRVITPFVGGGFGGKAPAQQGLEAARLAKLTGKPVIVVWSAMKSSFLILFILPE